MAYQLFQLPRPLNISSNLTLLSGAKALFELAETTTPTPVYQDQELTITHTNPVVADSAGVFDPIYLDPAIEYRVTLMTSANVVLPGYPQNYVNDQLLSREIIGSLLYPQTDAESAVPVTPIDYSKFPSPWKDISRFVNDNTGATDVSAQMANAFAAEKNIIIPDGTYLINGTSGQPALSARPGMRIEGATREGAILLAGTAGMYVLGYNGAHSNVCISNLLINGNNLASRGISSVSPSQGSSSGLMLYRVRAALCAGPAIYIKYMTYADICDVAANGSGEGLNLDTCFDSQVRGVSLFWDCTAAALSMSECSQVKVFGARLFTNTSVTAPRIAYVNSSSSCGFYDTTFESQSTTPVGAELEVDKAGTRETIDLVVDRCEFIGTAATKDRCVKLGSTATVYKPLFRDCRFFKPTSNESVLADRVAFGVFDGCRDITSYVDTAYVSPTIRQNNSSTFNVIDRALNGMPRAFKRYAIADNESVDLLTLISEYAPGGTGTATQAGFGGGIAFGLRTPLATYREIIARIVAAANASAAGVADIDFMVKASAAATPARALRVSYTSSVIAGPGSALATTATNGFMYVPTCAGTPTGVPTAQTGATAIVIDTTNNKLYFYSSGSWRDAGP
jgi:hypothetical protein